MTTKLDDELALGRVIEILPIYPYICSPIGFVQKHDGGLRRIHHLSYPDKHSVNDGIDVEVAYLKYLTFKTILVAVLVAGRGAIIVKRDLAEAFRAIPIAPHQRWLLGFQWLRRFFTECCLPFGLRTAPFIFNIFAELFHWILLSWLNWTLLFHYLDDFVHIIPLSEATLAQLAQEDAEFNLMADCLGIPLNESKKRVGQEVSILGIIVDTNKFEARLPLDKVLRAIDATSQALTKDSLSLREAQQLAGYLSHCAHVVRLGWVFMPSIYSYVASFSSLTGTSRRRIPADTRADILWWNTLLPQFNGVSFFAGKTRSTVYLYVDACKTGYGGFYYFDKLGRRWPEAPTLAALSNAFAIPSVPLVSDHQFSINAHEIEAILIAFELWASHWTRCRVIVHTDNANAYFGLRKQRLSGTNHSILRSVLLLAAKHDVIIHPVWIEGTSNTLADALSRSNWDSVTNLCPHWQDSLTTILRQRPG
jgi:hypothetical protein